MRSREQVVEKSVKYIGGLAGWIWPTGCKLIISDTDTLKGKQ